jgi:hypothetical protein
MIPSLMIYYDTVQHKLPQTNVIAKRTLSLFSIQYQNLQKKDSQKEWKNVRILRDPV